MRLSPLIPSNYRGEQAIRPAVVNRKVWGGNRTWLGARWQNILTTVLRTCEQRAECVFTYLINALSRPHPPPLPC
jgi:transposase